ncbi:hypothetical protein K5X82_14485 [Halosquirtibacter xylanolyticus]|uniref:hypothetical protein n=1 Tax=Halosquirtibacter xylanolyticus TaxID=3374599 RepID=UPI00374926D7|nr:hypothetical protein K5X82_14485 [Prolixibacteraceae bacterium]
MKKITFLLACLCIGLFSCNKKETFIITHNQIGQVTLQTTHEQLVKLYGDKSLKETMDEGTGALGTEVLFKNANNNIHITWQTSKKVKPVIIKTDNKNSEWKTKDGIHIGTTLSEVEKINGASFKIMGYEIDRDLAGTVTDWGKGTLNDAKIGFQFELTKEVGNDYMKLIGDKGISTNNEILKKAEPVVQSIFIVQQQ